MSAEGRARNLARPKGDLCNQVGFDTDIFPRILRLASILAPLKFPSGDNRHRRACSSARHKRIRDGDPLRPYPMSCLRFTATYNPVFRNYSREPGPPAT
jgi:hypothetical protein